MLNLWKHGFTHCMCVYKPCDCIASIINIIMHARYAYLCQAFYDFVE